MPMQVWKLTPLLSMVLAIGAIAGGKKGAAIGAAVGGAGGTTAVLATKGKDVRYPAEARLDFTLDQDITLAR